MRWTASFGTPVALLVVLAWCAGCGESGPTAAADASGDSVPRAQVCTPSRAVYDDNARALIAQHCGTCHGEKPAFGAPNTLTGSYESLLQGQPGSRLVDRMALRMAAKEMPPVGQPPVPHASLDLLTAWASCGAQHPDHSKGLQAEQAVFSAPAEAPVGVPTFDLRAKDFAVGPKTLDLYQCFTFAAPVEGDRFVRRIEAVVDRTEVVHHIVLLKDPDKEFATGLQNCKTMPKGSQYLYAWAPGTGAVQFPEGGLRIRPGEHYVVQVHYNNGAGLQGVSDNSGVRIWHAPPEGTEYGMVAPGPLSFMIPPQSTLSATGSCVVKNAVTVLAGMPHMHELGQSFRSEIVRADGSRETAVSLTGWSFEMQPFYHIGKTLQPGDRLETTCTWNNPGDTAVMTGENTSDEMCFLFAFVTPPPKDRYCNDFVVDSKSDVSYQPGPCAAADANPSPPRVTSQLTFGSLPPLPGGTLPDARWELQSATLVLPPLAKAQVDADKSLLVGRGQAWTTAAGGLRVDAAVRLLVGFGAGAGFDNVDVLSRDGTVAPDQGETYAWKATCGAPEGIKVRYAVDGKLLRVVVEKKLAQYTLPALYTFVRP